MKTNEILELRRAELKLMEMGAQLLLTLSRPITDPALEIEVLRKQFDIYPVNTLEITVTSLCKIPLIKWVRDSAPLELNTYYREDEAGDVHTEPKMTKMTLRKAKELVEEWIGVSDEKNAFWPKKVGQTVQFTVPPDWDMTIPMPEGLRVVY